MSVTATETPLAALRQAGAPGFDAVAWHYIEVLAERLGPQTGAAQALLQRKLDQALQNLQDRMNAAARSTASAAAMPAGPGHTSPLADLLHDLAARHATVQPTGKAALGRSENPRVQQFRQTLSKISVQKQVTQAIAQAPHNAGPINSHMLVLRSLSRMRELSPDYLNRFMAHVDTLLRLNEAGQVKPKKSVAASKAKK